MNTNMIYNLDCLEGMKKIEDKSIDMILSDLPYGTTQCKWDVNISLSSLWEQYKRVIKDNGAIVLTASQPFTSILINSNIKMFKYVWIWEKSKATGFLNVKKRPLVAHEDIVVFYKKQCIFNPQMHKGLKYNKGYVLRNTDVYGEHKETYVQSDGSRFPRSVLYFKTSESEGKTLHPTQKPLALFEYLIKTYTYENEIVLDSCIGSGTTAIACLKTKRKFIGFEKDNTYFSIANKRINDYNDKLSL